MAESFTDIYKKISGQKLSPKEIKRQSLLMSVQELGSKLKTSTSRLQNPQTKSEKLNKPHTAAGLEHATLLNENIGVAMYSGGHLGTEGHAKRRLSPDIYIHEQAVPGVSGSKKLKGNELMKQIERLEVTHTGHSGGKVIWHKGLRTPEYEIFHKEKDSGTPISIKEARARAQKSTLNPIISRKLKPGTAEYLAARTILHRDIMALNEAKAKKLEKGGKYQKHSKEYLESIGVRKDYGSTK